MEQSDVIRNIFNLMALLVLVLVIVIGALINFPMPDIATERDHWMTIIGIAIIAGFMWLVFRVAGWVAASFFSHRFHKDN